MQRRLPAGYGVQTGSAGGPAVIDVVLRPEPWREIGDGRVDSAQGTHVL